MLMMNVSEEQSVNSALQLAGTSGSAAFRFAKWIYKRSRETAKAAGNTLLEDACSVYRGGRYSSAQDQEDLRKLIRNLVGTEDVRLDGTNFLWTGKKTDLAYFWKKADAHNATPLLETMIADIPDEATKKKVVSVLTEARLNGLLSYNGKAYTLTKRGREAILKTDFVLGRLKDECRTLGIAVNVLEKEHEKKTDDKINAKLKELGIDPEAYNGCDRITLNKDKLLISKNEAAGTYQFFVPGTARREKVTIPAEDVIELDDNTFAAFLRPNRLYRYVKKGAPELAPTEEVKRHFDDKGKVPGKELTGAIEKAEQQAAAETDPLNSHPSVGEKWVVFETADDPHEYVITAGWKDFDDTVHFNMSSADGSRGELLLPEDSLGEIAFHSEEEGYRYISQNPERYAKDSHILSYQTQKEPTVHLIPKDAWQEEDAVYLIGNLKGRGRDGTLMIPKEEGIPQADGSLSVSLQRQNYAIKTGEYARPVSRGGADHFLQSRQLTKPVPQTVRKAAEKTAEAAATAAIEGGSSFSVDEFFYKSVRKAQRMMEETLKNAKTTTETATTVTKTAAHAIPPVEGVSATVKTVLTAVSKAGEAISAANSISQVRTR